MDIYAQIAQKIIEEQESIIGPVAIEQARRVAGLKVNWSDNHTVSVDGDEATVLDHLVEQYKELFGQISVEVCKEVASKLASGLSPQELPKFLK